jgi:hypothetical protein
MCMVSLIMRNMNIISAVSTRKLSKKGVKVVRKIAQQIPRVNKQQNMDMKKEEDKDQQEFARVLVKQRDQLFRRRFNQRLR